MTSDWIKIEDKFPPNGKSCIVFCCDKDWNWVGEAIVDNNKFYDPVEWYEEYKPVTHWMPLPDKPIV